MLLFIALGMIWSAARLFHGRQVRWGAMCFGATVWAASCMSSGVPHSPAARIMLSSVIVATYTFLIAAELWRERRKSLIRRWPAVFVPMLHGAIFLFPVALASLGVRSLATGWIAVFAIEVVLYVVGAAFIVLVLAKDRAVNRYKAAAETDPLDRAPQPARLLRRRRRADGRQQSRARRRSACSPSTSITSSRSTTVSATNPAMRCWSCSPEWPDKTMRADDVVGRIGGEEFVAIISGTLAEACIAAERVRSAFESAAVAPGSPQIPATVSIGVACGLPDVVDRRADRARRRRALSRQGERPQPRRAGR